MAAPAKKGSTALAVSAPTPVKFVISEDAVAEAYGLPAGFERAEEAPSSLSPTAEWTTPGEGMSGLFLGAQVGVGPNESRLYSFKLEDGTIVGVWGSAVIDRQMDLLRPDAGDRVAIVYVRDTEKKPGQNPARVFRMAKIPAQK
jgi:hypothetical protein